MKKFTFAVLSLFVFQSVLFSQEVGKKGTFYFGLGTHRSFYTKSDIRFISKEKPGFDFTLQKVRARDDQGFRLSGDGAAQYSYVIGYYFKKKNFGIEFNFDHLKYFVRQGQRVRVTGQIDDVTLDKDTTLVPSFVQLEHSDGANYAMLNFVKLKPLSGDERRGWELLLKAGAGVVVPKTNSTIMGVKYDDAYAVSGYVVGAEGGLRYHFLKNIFALASFKGAYANYNNFRIAGGHGEQQWWSGQLNVLVGAQFPL